MAPERFDGRVDPRSDVFSLGLTLYEMVTLQPAFTASGRAQMVERMLREQPPRPRKLDGRIPADLETLILKAIAKEPERRYQTAASELADDLTASSSPTGRFWRGGRAGRNDRAAGVAATPRWPPCPRP